MTERNFFKIKRFHQPYKKIIPEYTPEPGLERTLTCPVCLGEGFAVGRTAERRLLFHCVGCDCFYGFVE